MECVSELKYLLPCIRVFERKEVQDIYSFLKMSEREVISHKHENNHYSESITQVIAFN